MNARLHWGRLAQRWGRREPSSGGCVAQVNISSLEVSSPNHPPLFPLPEAHCRHGENGKGKIGIQHLPSTPGMIFALRGRCGGQNCKGQGVLPILIFPWELQGTFPRWGWWGRGVVCDRGTVSGQNNNEEFALQQSSQYLVQNPGLLS